MLKRILDSRILYLAVSVVLAVVLWFYVTATSDEPEAKSINNIPVSFTGVDLLEERNLMIVGEYTVSIRVRATPMVLSSLNAQSLKVQANVSGLGTEGTHSIAYVVDLPPGISRDDVTIESGVSGSVVNVEVARFNSREVPIRGVFTGSVAEGYISGGESDFMFSPARIVVSGRQELVNQVDHAQVIVDAKNLTGNVEGEFPFRLIDPSGNELDLDVTCDVDTVYVSFPVQATADIPLKVNLVAGGGLSENNVVCEMSTSVISVAGSREAVEAVKAAGAITLATIDLASIEDGYTQTFAVPLTDELSNISGETEVTVRITFKDELVTRTFQVTDISCFGLPEGWMADIVTQMVSVEVRGPESILDQITPENLQVSADLSKLNLTEGRYAVPATVRLHRPEPKSVVGVLNADYRIVVDLVEGYPEPPEPVESAPGTAEN